MTVTREELQLADSLALELAKFRQTNARKWAYYDGRAGIKNMGVAVPESMVNIEVVVGWPEIIVDALEERLDWLGWVASDQSSVDELMGVFYSNQLGTELSKAILDSLVTGVGFLEVSAGDVVAGEPQVIARAVSSSQATYRWDARRGRMAVGLVESKDAEGNTHKVLYYPDRTVRIWEDKEGQHRDEYLHNRGRCGLIAVPNKVRAGDVFGRSEISSTIQYLTDHGVRTMLGMEYNRELYTTPQRWYANVYAEQLGIDPDGSSEQIRRQGAIASMSRAVVMEPNEGDDGDKTPEPKTGQYQSAPPTPYIDELKMLSQLISAQSGVPANYLGFSSDNPPSADAIRAMEARLVKRSERRQSMISQVLTNDLAFVILAILEGEAPEAERIGALTAKWRAAHTPTMASAADSAMKLVSAGILDRESPVVLEMIGLDEQDQKRVAADHARGRARDLLKAVRQQATDSESTARSAEVPEAATQVASVAVDAKPVAE